MNDFPAILNTPIINNEWDLFWQELPQQLADGNRPLLIISAVFDDLMQAQLQKMLQACAITTEQYIVIQLQPEDKIAWNKLKEKLAPKAVLLLGVLPSNLGISAMFHLFAPNSFDNCIWICSPSLQELEQQPEHKKLLWQNGLKPVFVDKSIGNF